MAVSDKQKRKKAVKPSEPDVLPPEQEAKKSQLISQESTYEGPLPPPDIFKQFGEIIPDAPERILSVFEADSKHARDIEMAALNAQKGDNRRVHWMSWSLVAATLVLSLIFAHMGYVYLSGIALSTTIGAIVLNFLREKSKRRK